MRASSFRHLLTLVFLLFLALSANAQSWRQVGPSGGDVQSLAVTGSTRTHFLDTSDGHVFGSHDAGEHWELLGRIGEPHNDLIMSMIVDPRSERTLSALRASQAGNQLVVASATGGLFVLDMGSASSASADSIAAWPAPRH
jgi:hypothetical protein